MTGVSLVRPGGNLDKLFTQCYKGSRDSQRIALLYEKCVSTSSKEVKELLTFSLGMKVLLWAASFFSSRISAFFYNKAAEKIKGIVRSIIWAKNPTVGLDFIKNLVIKKLAAEAKLDEMMSNGQYYLLPKSILQAAYLNQEQIDEIIGKNTCNGQVLSIDGEIVQALRDAINRQRLEMWGSSVVSAVDYAGIAALREPSEAKGPSEKEISRYCALENLLLTKKEISSRDKTFMKKFDARYERIIPVEGPVYYRARTTEEILPPHRVLHKFTPENVQRLQSLRENVEKESSVELEYNDLLETIAQGVRDNPLLMQELL